MAHPQAAEVGETLRRAVALHQQGQLREADTLYRGILDAAPDHFDALHLYGVLKQQSGEPVEALKLIARALVSNDRSAVLDRALALSPENADILVARGNAYYALQSYAVSLADYERAIAVRLDAAPLHNNRGNTLRELGRHPEALDSFARALALDPGYADAYTNRGNTLLELNRPAEALADYERALARKPDFTYAAGQRRQCIALPRSPRRSADELRSCTCAGAAACRRPLEQGAGATDGQRARGQSRAGNSRQPAAAHRPARRRDRN